MFGHAVESMRRMKVLVTSSNEISSGNPLKLTRDDETVEAAKAIVNNWLAFKEGEITAKERNRRNDELVTKLPVLSPNCDGNNTAFLGT